MSHEFNVGDVIYFVALGNRNGRRVLVEEIDATPSEQASLVKGVEVTSRLLGFRGRRGTRPRTAKWFWLYNPTVREIVPAADKRVTALRERLTEWRNR